MRVGQAQTASLAMMIAASFRGPEPTINTLHCAIAPSYEKQSQDQPTKEPLTQVPNKTNKGKRRRQVRRRR